MGEADEKSPKPEPMLSVRALVLVGWIGGEVCFGGGAGLASKKEPPLRRSPPCLAEVCRACVVEVDVVVVGKAVNFGCDEVKERPPNASFMPPNDDWLPVCDRIGAVRGGEDIPAKASMFDIDAGCCCCTCG